MASVIGVVVVAVLIFSALVAWLAPDLARPLGRLWGRIRR